MSYLNRILVVDDEEDIRNVVPRLLSQSYKRLPSRVEFDVASSLKQMHEKLAAEVFDVAILDLVLPPDGKPSTMREIPALSKRLAVVVLTGDVTEDTRDRCLLTGAADFMLKEDAIRRPELLLEKCYNAAVRRHATV